MKSLRPLRITFAAVIAANVAALTVAAAGPAQAVVGATAEGDGFAITIISPVADETVSGTLEVSYVVTFPNESSDHRVFASVGNTLDAPSVGIDLTGVDCSAGCEETATLDTTADALTDGSTWLTVKAYRDGEPISARFQVNLDNQRPRITVGGVVDGRVTAGDSLDVDATITSPADARIASADWVSGQTITPMTPPTAPGLPWTVVVDTSTAANGIESGTVRARDERGLVSTTAVSYIVDHGPSLSVATAVPDPVLDNALSSVVLSYSWKGYMGDTSLTKLDTYLDGALVDTVPADYYTTPSPGHIEADAKNRIPGGHHTLRYVATDSRGATGALDVPIDVVTTLTSAWTAGAGSVVLPKTPLTLQALSTSTDPSSPLWYGDMTIDGLTYQSRAACGLGCSQTLTSKKTIRFDKPGRHQVKLEVYPKLGWSQVISTTVTVLPYATARIAPVGTATYGVARTLRGLVTTDAGRAAPGTPTRLQRKSNGTWATVASAVSNAAGAVSFRIVPRTTTTYRMLTSNVAGDWGAKVGPALTLRTKATVGIRSVPRRLKRGAAFAVTGFVHGPRSRIILESSNRNHWTPIATARQRADGIVVVRISHRKAARIEGHRKAIKFLLVRRSADGLASARSKRFSITITH